MGSEEALEARHKEIRKHRLGHTPKTSREDTNTDLFNVLLLTSDPLISSHRKATSKKQDEDFTEIKEYLAAEQDESNDSINFVDLQISLSELENSD